MRSTPAMCPGCSLSSRRMSRSMRPRSWSMRGTSRATTGVRLLGHRLDLDAHAPERQAEPRLDLAQRILVSLGQQDDLVRGVAPQLILQRLRRVRVAYRAAHRQAGGD